MFESLSDKLQAVFKKLRGESRLTEANIADAMREIRVALLEADVNINVAKKFVEDVKNECIGAEVLQSVTPGQQAVKIVHDKLVDLLGGEATPLQTEGNPAIIMLVGLHGSGKTTTAGKLALHLKKAGKKVLLVAGDVYRPAAIDQLETLGKEIDVPVHIERTSVNVAAIAKNAVDNAKSSGMDVVIIDTAGRLQIDEPMVQELIRVRQTVMSNEILLVADAALGQEAVDVATHFHNALTLTGLILTKLDGDARGGAALSIRQVTGVPIKFVGSGEKLDALEPFFPDRMAGRILGMGDVVSLVERAAKEIDEKEAEALQEKLRKNKFDYNDFLSQLKMLSRLGGFEGMLKFLPGGRQIAQLAKDFDPRQFHRLEAIILSMTKKERENPDIIDFARRKRIARGAGVTVEAVGNLTKQFDMLRKMLRGSGPLGKMMASGVPPKTMPGGGFAAAPAPISKKAQEHKKALAKLARKARQKQRKHKK